MRRSAYSWELLSSLTSASAVTELQDLEFCCSRVTHTDPVRRCQICTDEDHEMWEQRRKCMSVTCKVYGTCKFGWKVWGCAFSGQWHIYHNRMRHSRGDKVECHGIHKTVITEEMKTFILQQDECAVPPQLILSNMRRCSDIIAPRRGYPSLSQVTNCAKYLRRLQGTKNSVKAVKKVVQQHSYDPCGDYNKAFCFGSREDEDGYAYVGKGTDQDSFVVGVTSQALVDSCIGYASSTRFTMFHADATFKLSDLGYPVITCGFSDAARTYQLAAIFIVSRRTAKEYGMCLSSLVRVIKRVRPMASLHIDAVMGDAEDAQLNGFQQVPEFTAATYLMCFFHVLYNVRKRTKHMTPATRKAVMDGIIRLHYSENMNVFYLEKDDVLKKWRDIPELEKFVKYFREQWLDSRYWRWQAFHTPIGYATTNNPCEPFNALLKKYTGRRRFFMQGLLVVTMTVIEDAPKRKPTTDTEVQAPSTATSRAAAAMIKLGKVNAFLTDNPSLCRVQLLSKEEVEAEKLAEVCDVLDSPFHATAENSEDVEGGNLVLGPALLVREQRTRAAQLYKNVVSWSLWYAHTSSMPDGGWIVDIEKCSCGCKYYIKFKTCCHIIVARKQNKLQQPGVDDASVKLFNRQIRKKTTQTTSHSDQRSSTSNAEVLLPLREPSHGRPLLASRALDVQFLLCPDT